MFRARFPGAAAFIDKIGCGGTLIWPKYLIWLKIVQSGIERRSKAQLYPRVAR